VISILYTWIDFAQEQNPIPFRDLIQNPYFFLYWFLQLAGSCLAFYLLLSYPPIKDWPALLIALVAVFSSSLVLQNQLIKIGDKPVLDLSPLQKGLRVQVIAAAIKTGAKKQKARMDWKTEQLALKYRDNVGDLEEIYKRLLLSAGKGATEILEEITAIKDRSERLLLPVQYEFARKIVLTDTEYATRVLYHRGS